ncbi:hypothetical protein SADUNF_Sadunf18G0077300 [Salix dunnii]|uniref:Thaumatin-like protein n=1 Tax=Salix dunnii TaxID=1413687 RepID=A0A835MDY3_9ROSI|nr:hypothetical protein SADUNF_Sadunf18G0077300 [Salix dunnii]
MRIRPIARFTSHGVNCCQGHMLYCNKYLLQIKKHPKHSQIITTHQLSQLFTMGYFSSFSLFPCFLLLAHFLTLSSAATFEVRNQCPYTVWAAAVPGGGRRLDRGQSWTISVAAGTKQARIWGRTNCNFDGAGRGRCQTGDCNGLLQCQGYGQPPNTLAEYALNQYNNLDFFDISLVDGFNVPMVFSPVSGNCRGIRCVADINGQCPNQLRAPGGCNNPCTVFKTDQYCCNSGNCGPTDFSRFFKQRCPDAYSYPKDDQTSTFTCPGGTNYRLFSMGYFYCFSLFPCFLLFAHFFTLSSAATFEVRNQCPYTVWAAAVPGGGQRLDPGQSWTITAVAGTTQARIWGRTNCNFDGAGRGRCQTGDCNGLLQCQGYGQPPNTLAEYALNQFNNLDFFDISLVDGFNYPATAVESGARLISMDSALMSSGPQEAATILAPSTGLISIVATLAAVPPQISLGFSSRGALTLIVILKMTKQAPSLVPVELITGLCSALEAILNQHFNAFEQPSNTLAEDDMNQFSNIDFYDIYLVDGFNVPMNFSPVSAKCRGMRCTADINGQCSKELRAPGNCNNPCTVFKTDQYCCNSGNYSPIDLSSFFK